jgi:hypothetical protein
MAFGRPFGLGAVPLRQLPMTTAQIPLDADALSTVSAASNPERLGKRNPPCAESRPPSQ